MKQATFADVKNLLESYGLIPANVDDDGYLGEISEPTYMRLMDSVTSAFGNDVASFIARWVSAVDGWFYLDVPSWEALEASF